LQTLATFEDEIEQAGSLPKSLNNLNFSSVLDMWKERVVDTSERKQSELLSEQYEEIIKLTSFRNALVHGMWDWGPDELGTITSTRIRKKEIVTVKFTLEILVDFFTRLAEINFNVRYPGGLEEFAQQKAKNGPYFSRRALSIFSNNPLSDDWLVPLPGQNEEE